MVFVKNVRWHSVIWTQYLRKQVNKMMPVWGRYFLYLWYPKPTVASSGCIFYWKRWKGCTICINSLWPIAKLHLLFILEQVSLCTIIFNTRKYFIYFSEVQNSNQGRICIEVLTTMLTNFNSKQICQRKMVTTIRANPNWNIIITYIFTF